LIIRECISATTLSSFSTAAILSADVGWGLPNPRKDMAGGVLLVGCRLAKRISLRGCGADAAETGGPGGGGPQVGSENGVGGDVGWLVVW